MNIEKSIDGTSLTLKVIGRLDTNTSPQLQDELALDGIKEVVFDLSQLDYMSSAGLRVLLTAQKAMLAAGGRMTVRNPNAMVKGVFDITGCSDIFTIE